MTLSRRLFLSATALFLSLLGTSGVQAAKYHVYIGTYTDPKGSKGIYLCEFDDKDGTLSKPELVAEMINPSFVAISPNEKYLYAVSETTKTGNKPEGGVVAFAIAKDTGKLTKLNETTTGGTVPCHVSFNKTGKYALIANYGSGSSIMFEVKEDGKIGERKDFRQHQGKGPNQARQEGPHAHCGVFRETSEGEFAYVVDLGVDKVFSYKLDSAKGELKPTEPPYVELPPGSGPRHLSFHKPSGKAFVCGELDSTLIPLRAHEANGTLQRYDAKGPHAPLSTLPEGASKKGNSTAEVLVHPDNKHVLVSNRGYNSLAVFEFNADSTKAIGHIQSAGDRKIATPRNFNFDPSGKWVLIASQDGDSVRVAEWDASGNGKLTAHKLDVPKPVCVKFLKK